MEKTLLTQIAEIKFQTVSLLTYQHERLTLTERARVLEVYELMDSILLDKLHSPRHTAEDYADALILEHSIILKGSKNSEVRKLSALLEKGLQW